MTIHVLVQAIIDQRQAKATADELADSFDGTGARAAEKFGGEFDKGMAEASPRIQRSFHGIENAISRVTDRKEDYDKAMESGSEQQQERAARQLEVAQRALADAYRGTGAAVSAFSAAADKDMERSARNRMAMANAHRKQIEDDAEAARKAAEKLANSAMSITDQLADMGRTAGMAFRGTAMLGAPIILLDIAGAAGALAGVLGPMTGALGAAAVGMGTFKLATAGFSDAISNMGDTEKFVESLKGLSPEAQQAALSLRSLMPVLDELQRATQNAFFSGSGAQLQTFLGQMLPMVRETTTGVASAFNEMFNGITNQMMSSGTFASIESFAHNTVNAFHELAPAAAPFVSALSDIASVGSGFLPLLAQQISGLAQEFSTWISEAKADGSLEEWMARGINAAENLLSVTDDLAKMFDSLGDRGTGAINKIVAGVELLSGSIRVLSGDLSGLGDMASGFEEVLTKPFETVRDIINQASKGINLLIRGINSVTGSNIAEIPELNPIGDVARGRDMFGGPVWLDNPPPGAPDPGAPSPTRGENRTSRPGGIRTPFPMPGERFGFPDAGNGLGIGNRIAGTGTWQSPIAPGQGGINGRSGRSGRKPKGQDWSAPSSEWSLDNVPIGSFPGVPGPPGMPNVPTTPLGPVDPQAMWDAQSRSESARFRVEETRQRYLELAHDNTTSETDLLKAKHDVSESERDYISAQMKAAEVARGKFKDLTSGMDQIGAALDNDFGLSEGLPGLAKNLTMFLANLAAAPALGEMQRTANAAEAQGQPTGGFGILGINGAQNIMSGLTPLFGQRPSAGGGFTFGGPSGVQSATGANAAAYSGGGAYPGDAALLANAPKGIGRYDNDVKDLSRGLVDCASGVEDLVNIMDGKSTVGGSLWTGNASTVLPQMGFLPGMGGPGDFRIGYRNGGPGGGHMQATLPGGTNVNFGSTPAIQSGGVAPNSGAYDPSFDQHYYRPAGGPPTAGPSSGTTTNGAPNVPIPDITNPGLYDPSTGTYGGAPAGFGNFTGSSPFQIPGVIGQGVDHYDANKPTGGGNINPNFKIDISQASVAPPPGAAGASGTGTAPLGFTGGGLLDVSGQRMLDMGTGLTKRPGEVGYSTGMGPPIVPNIGPGPLQVGPPSVPGTGAPGQIGPFPTPAGIGPAPLGGGVGGLAGQPATPGGVAPGPQTHYGGVEPGVAMGGPGGVGMQPGGMLDTALQGAAAGLDLLAPGAGQAAQTGIKLANRAIQQAGQYAGIGIGGLMETFLPTGGSELANGGWLPRIVGGLAGAKPALPNLAGGKGGTEQPPLTPDQVQQQGMTAPAGQGPNLSVTVNNNGATPDQNGSAVAYHAQQAQTMPGVR